MEDSRQWSKRCHPTTIKFHFTPSSPESQAAAGLPRPEDSRPLFAPRALSGALPLPVTQAHGPGCPPPPQPSPGCRRVRPSLQSTIHAPSPCRQPWWAVITPFGRGRRAPAGSWCGPSTSGECRDHAQEGLAETEGFEPSVPVDPVQRFSKPSPSATRPRLHASRYLWIGRRRVNGTHRQEPARRARPRAARGADEVSGMTGSLPRPPAPSSRTALSRARGARLRRRRQAACPVFPAAGGRGDGARTVP